MQIAIYGAIFGLTENYFQGKYFFKTLPEYVLLFFHFQSTGPPENFSLSGDRLLVDAASHAFGVFMCIGKIPGKIRIRKTNIFV